MKLAAICLLLLFPSIAVAGMNEERAYSAFERYCILASADEVPHLLAEIDARPITGIAAAELLQQSGREWVAKNKTDQFTVFLTDTGACGMQFAGIDFSTMRSLIEKRMLNKLAEYSENEQQRWTAYTTRTPDQVGNIDTLLLVMLLGGKLGVMKDHVTISAIPKADLGRYGMDLQWP